jgi:hypothetical protein
MELLYVSSQVSCNGSSSSPPVIHLLSSSAFPVVSPFGPRPELITVTCCEQRMLTLTIVLP